MNQELRIKEKINTFQDLTAWKKAHILVLEVYKLTKDFPKEEQFGLINQLRRAAVSITSNIAEGFSRTSYREKCQFYAVALGSLTETQNQLLISKDIGYLSSEKYSLLEAQSIEVHKIMNGLIKTSKSLILNS